MFNCFNESALNIAVEKNNLGIVNLLLSNESIDVNSIYIFIQTFIAFKNPF